MARKKAKENPQIVIFNKVVDALVDDTLNEGDGNQAQRDAFIEEWMGQLTPSMQRSAVRRARKIAFPQLAARLAIAAEKETGDETMAGISIPNCTAGDVAAFFAGLPPDMPVVMATDDEGNDYRKLGDLQVGRLVKDIDENDKEIWTPIYVTLYPGYESVVN